MADDNRLRSPSGNNHWFSARHRFIPHLRQMIACHRIGYSAHDFYLKLARYPVHLYFLKNSYQPLFLRFFCASSRLQIELATKRLKIYENRPTRYQLPPLPATSLSRRSRAAHRWIALLRGYFSCSTLDRFGIATKRLKIH